MSKLKKTYLTYKTNIAQTLDSFADFIYLFIYFLIWYLFSNCWHNFLSC